MSKSAVRREFVCESCEENNVAEPWHEGTVAHLDQYNGKQLYAVTCPRDGLTEWLNLEWPNRVVEVTPLDLIGRGR